MSNYQQELAAKIAQATNSGKKVYRFQVNAILRTVEVVERKTGEIIDTLYRQSEKMIKELRNEYDSSVSFNIISADTDTVLARWVEGGEGVPSMQFNAKRIPEGKRHQFTSFLVAADQLDLVTADSGFESIVPISNGKSWDAEIFGVQNPKGIRDNEAVSENASHRKLA